jgi:TRAP-type C4-dicarboxylate transport system substrate-binding protein
MDRRRFLKASAAGAAFSVAAPYVSLHAAPLIMRFAHFAAEDHPANIAAKQFASRVEERTSGAVKINIFPNNVLGGPPEQAQQIKLGTIDMGLPTQGQLDKYDKAFAAVMLPFIWDGPHGLARAARRKAGLHPTAQLGIRLPQRDQYRASDQHPG